MCDLSIRRLVLVTITTHIPEPKFETGTFKSNLNTLTLISFQNGYNYKEVKEIRQSYYNYIFFLMIS